MLITNIHNAKSHLSKYLRAVASGEEVIICSYDNPIAKIVPYSKKYNVRKPGILKGKIDISTDFEEFTLLTIDKVMTKYPIKIL